MIKAALVVLLTPLCQDLLAKQLPSGPGPAARLLPTMVQLLQHAPLPAQSVQGEHDERLSWAGIASLAEVLAIALGLQVRAVQLLPDSNSAAIERLARQNELLLPLIPRFAAILKAFYAVAQAKLLLPCCDAANEAETQGCAVV